jgi:hypothetical protein
MLSRYQKDCPVCIKSYNDKAIKFSPLKLQELEKGADTAFAKIYSSEEYSQEFLENLIPRR